MKDVLDSGALERLVALVARLRAPDGCPWDREQGLADLRAYLLEEAHELAAALDGGDWEAIAAELGDLLFQVAFLVRLAEEAGAFGPSEIAASAEAKMIARHPHVFGEERLTDARQVRAAWERRKLGEPGRAGSLLDGVPGSLPALLAAYRMTQKAAGVGFDWPDAHSVLAKVDEELAELRESLAGWAARESAPLASGSPRAAGSGGDASARDRRRAAEELGDLLFTLANLGRHLGIDPEAALAGANAKFAQRFRRVEADLATRGRSLAEADLAEMDRLWEAAKEDAG